MKELHYKGIIFDNWEDSTKDNVTEWSGMCDECRKKHQNILQKNK